MGKTTSNENATGAKDRLFTRKRSIGIDPINCDKDRPNVFVQIESERVETFVTKNYPAGIPCMDVIDMENGTEHKLWLSGQLRHTFNELSQKGSLKGMRFEIEWRGKTPYEFVNESGKMEKTQVNNYGVYELN